MPKTFRDKRNRLMGAAHSWVYKVSKGRVGGSMGTLLMGKAKILVLHTTGAKTGKPRSNPLIYVEEAGAYVVVASNAGQDHAPGWFHNLQKQPACSVEVGARTIAVQATVVPAADAAALWPRVDAAFKAFATYRARTQREIPLVRLTPAP